MPKPIRYPIRFWTRVDLIGNCWEWRGARNQSGYGTLSNSAGMPPLAHRASWVLHHGPIPQDADICHSCDNPSCVNPSHLWIGDAKSNGADMAAKGRSAFARYGNRITPSGEEHWTHRKPGLVKRGAAHYRRIDPMRGPIGEANGNAKVTADIVRSIRLRAAAGDKQLTIAADFAVSTNVVSRIVTRKTWRHVN